MFEAGDDDDSEYWLDEAARIAADYGVDTDLPLLDAPVTDADLQTAGIHDLEVHHAPQLSNPLWVTKTELARLEPLLPEWPGYEEKDEVQIGDPLRDFYVEEAAMEAVRGWYEAEGWDVEDVSADKVGWDLTCTHPDGRSTRAEVKGLSGVRPVVLLTANEHRAASEEEDWLLVIVTRALTDPLLHDFTGPETVAASKAYVYRTDLSAAEDGIPACPE